ncbi:MAG: response regulator transcription factor, partial [Chloroflexi bacterium]|nr:response regulator transcription factor [Chloroflexota bacterium]
MTTILLVDDHAVVRSGLKTIIEKQDDLHVIGEAADGSEAIDQIRKLRPDLVVMDLTMPKKSGLEVSTDICKEFPDIKVLVFTMHGN